MLTAEYRFFRLFYLKALMTWKYVECEQQFNDIEQFKLNNFSVYRQLLLNVWKCTKQSSKCAEGDNTPSISCSLRMYGITITTFYINVNRGTNWEHIEHEYDAWYGGRFVFLVFVLDNRFKWSAASVEFFHDVISSFFNIFESNLYELIRNVYIIVCKWVH